MQTAMVLASEALQPARYQMALSLGFHIVIACFGVAFPALIYLAHRRGLQGDEHSLELARRWAKVSGVLFAIGAVSGTILSLEFGVLWPGFMERFGDVIGLTFAVEGLFFFTEAIFLGIYLYGWDRLPPRVHLLTILPMAVAGIGGSFAVLSANAWMNSPTGFRIEDGEVVDPQPLAAIFNDAVWLQWIHMWLAAYMVVGFVVAAVHAAGLRREPGSERNRTGFRLAMVVASVATVLQPVVGHFAGDRLVEAQPSKLAAIELSTETEAEAPLVIGGVLVDGEVEFGIEIPKLGSLIAGGSTNAVLPGLADQPEGDEVPATVVHLAFQTMVGIGFALVGLCAFYWWRRRRDGDPESNPWFLRAVGVAGVAAPVAMLAGWTVTEVGRQPWIVYRVMRVDEAVTEAGWIWWSFGIVTAVYVSMTVIAVRILRSMSRRWAAGDDDIRAPYGPTDRTPGRDEAVVG